MKKIEKLADKDIKQINAELNSIVKQLLESTHAIQDNDRIRRSARTFINGSFVNLFSRHDAFIMDVIRHHYSSTDLIESSDRQLKYSDLLASGVKNLSQIKSRYIDEDIENLRNNRVKQLEFIEKITNKKILETVNAQIPLYIEASERRNLIVHHNGKVTNKYKSVLRAYGLKPDNLQRISIDSAYFESILKVILEISSEVGFVINNTPKKKEKMTSVILDNFTINMIRNEKYELAEASLDILRRHGLEDEYYYINMGLCAKRKEEKNKLSDYIKKLNELDALGKLHRLSAIGLCLLKDNPESALSIIKSVSSEKDILIMEILMGGQDQPIFSEFIQTSEYKKTIAKTRRTLKRKPSKESRP
jgi:hypothetical protein